MDNKNFDENYNPFLGLLFGEDDSEETSGVNVVESDSLSKFTNEQNSGVNNANIETNEYNPFLKLSFLDNSDEGESLSNNNVLKKEDSTSTELNDKRNVGNEATSFEKASSDEFNPFVNVNRQDSNGQGQHANEREEVKDAEVITADELLGVEEPVKSNTVNEFVLEDEEFDDYTEDLGEGIVKKADTRSVIASLIVMVAIPVIIIPVFSIYKIIDFSKKYVPVLDRVEVIVDGDLINYEDNRETDTNDDEPDSTAFIGDNVNTIEDISIDWQGLSEKNPDIVAWIVIPGTQVNYPVTQCQDNQTYLKTAFDGSYSVYGTIFMNAACKNDFSSWNTILYGHNMKNGSMFKTVNYYADEEFYKEHKQVWVITPTWNRVYNIISSHEATDCDETYTACFNSEDEYLFHVDYEKKKSAYDTGVEAVTNKKMLTLSTCSGKGGLSRRVLICQPAEDGIEVISHVPNEIDEKIQNAVDDAIGKQQDEQSDEDDGDNSTDESLDEETSNEDNTNNKNTSDNGSNNGSNDSSRDSSNGTGEVITTGDDSEEYDSSSDASDVLIKAGWNI